MRVNIKILVGGVFYLFAAGTYLFLFFKVRQSEAYYDEIPNESKYRSSIFYIGDYSTPYAQRSKRSIREAVFYLVGILSWFFVLMTFFIFLHIWYTQSVEEYVLFSSTGLLITVTIALFLSVVYTNVFLFLKNPFITSVCLCQTRKRRGEMFKRKMLLCLIATLLLMPFALLGTNSYVYMTDEGLYENAYFSLTEEEYRFDKNQVLWIEKQYNDKGELSGLRCYMKNEETQINILDADLGLEMIKGILQNPNMSNVQITGDFPITYEEAEMLLENANSSDTEIVLKWFLNEYLCVVI